MIRKRNFCIILICAFGLAHQAKADDIYNFYFQKSREPAIEKSKSKTISTKVEIPQTQRHYKTWETSLGVGLVTGLAKVSYDCGSQNTCQTIADYAQKLFILGGSYNISRYFNVHGAFHIPAGDMEGIDGGTTIDYSGDGYRLVPINKASSFDFQMLIGGGVTPFHFDFLDFTFLEIGLDLSFLIGDENYLGGNTTAMMWGPRFTFLFSRSFVMTVLVKQELQRRFETAELSNANLSFGYRF